MPRSSRADVEQLASIVYDNGNLQGFLKPVVGLYRRESAETVKWAMGPQVGYWGPQSVYWGPQVGYQGPQVGSCGPHVDSQDSKVGSQGLCIICPTESDQRTPFYCHLNVLIALKKLNFSRGLRSSVLNQEYKSCKM